MTAKTEVKVTDYIRGKSIYLQVEVADSADAKECEKDLMEFGKKLKEKYFKEEILTNKTNQDEKQDDLPF